MKLRWIQRYYHTGLVAPPCEFIEGCGRRAVGMWVDQKGHCHDLCDGHATVMEAPPMGEVCYGPTQMQDVFHVYKG